LWRCAYLRIMYWRNSGVHATRVVCWTMNSIWTNQNTKVKKQHCRNKRLRILSEYQCLWVFVCTDLSYWILTTFKFKCMYISCQHRCSRHIYGHDLFGSTGGHSIFFLHAYQITHSHIQLFKMLNYPTFLHTFSSLEITVVI